jgi:hypothetical protein
MPSDFTRDGRHGGRPSTRSNLIRKWYYGLFSDIETSREPPNEVRKGARVRSGDVPPPDEAKPRPFAMGCAKARSGTGVRVARMGRVPCVAAHE